MIARPAVRVHPHGLCESEDVGAGTRVWAFAHVLAGASIGRGCNICDGVFVEDGVVLGDRVTVKTGTLLFAGVSCEDDVFLGPGVVFTTDLRPRAARRKAPEELLRTVVRRGATIGAGAVIVCGTEVGRHAFVGAGAVVTASVPAYAFVIGNPAQRQGWVCCCGRRLLSDLTCPECAARYRTGPDGTVDREDEP